MPYNSRTDVVYLLAERYDTKSNVKLGGFQSQLQTSYMSSYTEEFWYNKTICLWMTIYIHIYIYIYVCVCVWFLSKEIDMESLDKAAYISHKANTLGLGINPLINLPAMNK